MSNYQQLYEKTKNDLDEIQAELADFKGRLANLKKNENKYLLFRNK